MSKIPFDIKFRPQIESGEYKVVTGDDRPVRIISWDKKVFGGRYEIVALVPTSQGDTEAVQLYCPDGTLISSNWNEKFKLFVVTPEPELTEFEKAFDNLAESYHSDENPDYVACCKEYAAELLTIARKQLQPEIDAEIDNAYKNSDSIVYENGVLYGKAEALEELKKNLADNDIYRVPEWLREVLAMAKENGKKEALKDLPRWKPSNCPRSNLPSLYLTGDGTALYKDGYEISISGLEKLPKEETNL